MPIRARTFATPERFTPCTSQASRCRRSGPCARDVRLTNAGAEPMASSDSVVVKSDPPAVAHAAAVAPTRVRHIVLWLTVVAYMITYIDRVVISAAVPSIQEEFGF